MKFEAKKCDLELQLITLAGKETTLNPNKIITAEETIMILKQWTTLEDKAKTNIERVQLTAAELAIVYPKEAKWFLTNFDIATLSHILEFVAKTLGGIRKNAESSN